MLQTTKGIKAVLLVLLATLAVAWFMDSDGVFMVTLVLTYIFTTIVLVGTRPSPHPSTWWFAFPFVVLVLVLVAFLRFRAYVGAAVPGTMACLLIGAWWGTRRNFKWAWDWTRRVYMALFACLLMVVAVAPLAPGRFNEVYEVEKRGLFWSICVYLLQLAILAALLVRSRDVFKTPANARSCKHTRLPT